MQYTESVEKSAELLRLALALMSKQAAGFHPVSYAVWYEYVAGNNAALRQAVDSLGLPLDEQMTYQMFYTHVACVDAKLAKRVSDGFKSVMTDVSNSVAQAGDHAGEFGTALEKWGMDLASRGESQGVGTLIDLTRGMQSAITSLQADLDGSRKKIDQLQQEVVKAREEALADPLTGLTNRRGFEEAMVACLGEAESSRHAPCLLVVDIDHFKRVNDNYGHLFGDRVIRALATILKDNVRGKDTVARYGGEEFVILLPDTPLEGARQLAEKLRGVVERCRVRHTGKNEVVATITTSLGVASYKRGESPANFFNRADAALYRSKQDGRNRVTIARS